jgi:hypothetical protein
MLRSLLAVAAVASFALPLAASGNPIQPQLDAKVTARSISLTDANGRRVRVLIQNSYRIVVRDSSKAQNFHLVGPRVNLKTKASATGMRTWTVILRPGKYVYTSDRSTRLRGSFTVQQAPPPA